MHNVEVFVNYDPPCNSVSTARRLNKRSSSCTYVYMGAKNGGPSLSLFYFYLSIFQVNNTTPQAPGFKYL